MSLFMQRSSVDLPEPERPMRTNISPFLTSKETSYRPTLLEVMLWTSSLLFPSLRSASASSGRLPKIFERFLTRIIISLPSSSLGLSIPANMSSAVRPLFGPGRCSSAKLFTEPFMRAFIRPIPAVSRSWIVSSTALSDLFFVVPEDILCHLRFWSDRSIRGSAHPLKHRNPSNMKSRDRPADLKAREPLKIPGRSG